jgi:hypothetical protein
VEDESHPRSPPVRRRSGAASIRITGRDRRVLGLAAEHRLVLAAHVQRLLGVSANVAYARLRALTGGGYLRYERKLTGPGCYLIERRGLGAIGSQLPRPRDVDLARYRHDVGLAWLWLAAGAGAFGAVRELTSERHMRSHDGGATDGDATNGVTEGRGAPLGVRLPGVGPHGGERRHYPDLLLETRTGHRVAIELELTTKSAAKREQILGGYAADARIDAVLYLAEREPVARAVANSAAALGISSLVHVQRVRFGVGDGTATSGRAPERTLPRTTRRSEPVR